MRARVGTGIGRLPRIVDDGSGVHPGGLAHDLEQAEHPHLPADTRSPASSASPERSDQAEAVRAATVRFVEAAFTIGYPDRTFEDYTERLRPLMTDGGYAELRRSETIRQNAKVLPTLYVQRARSRPVITGDAPISVTSSTAARASVTYVDEFEQNRDGTWQRTQTLDSGSVQVVLVRRDGTWLVDSST